jgi:putative chitinase
MDRKAFFDAIRKPLFGGTFTGGQIEGIDAVLDEAELSKPSLFGLSCMFATDYHEVGGKMQPRLENMKYSAARICQVWPSRFPTVASAAPYANNPQKLANKVYGGRMGNTGPNDGWLYRGAGIPQITGKGMFEKLGKMLGIDLVGNPALALDLKTSVKIMFVGMENGAFTGKKIADFEPRRDYAGSRAIINADVKKNGPKIAEYALIFEAALKAARYGVDSLDAHSTPPVVSEPEPVIGAGGIFRYILAAIAALFRKGP